MADVPTQEPAPTQEFPPWLSPSVMVTQINGVEVTETIVVQLPLTYFGPSIPLGPGWVFGGSTFPASIATGPPTISPTPSPTPSEPTVTPTTSESSIPTTAPATSSTPISTSTTPTSVSTSSSTPLSSTSSSASAIPTAGSLANGRNNLTIVLATIIPIVTVIALLLALWCCWYRPRRRRARVVPIEEEWQDITPPRITENEMEAGEVDPFMPPMRERGVLGVFANPFARRQRTTVMQNTAHTTSSGGSRSGTSQTTSLGTQLTSSTNPSGAARFNPSRSTVDVTSLFFNPARTDEAGRLRSSSEDPGALVEGPAERPHEESGSPLDELDVRNPDDAETLAHAEEPGSPATDDPNVGLLGGAVVHRDPAKAANRKRSYASSGGGSHPSTDWEDRATLLTAQRINVGTPRRPVFSNVGSSEKGEKSSLEKEDSDVLASPTSRGSISSSRLWYPTRTSWFARLNVFSSTTAGPSGTRHSSDGSSNKSSPVAGNGNGNGSRPPSSYNFRPGTRPHSGILHPPRSRPVSGLSFLQVDPELGARPPGMRISGTGSASGGSVSGKSGQTVYHDARSTPGSLNEEASSLVDAPAPPELDLADQTIRAVDVLDLPAPETTLPLTAPLLPDYASDSRTSSLASRGTGLRYPPGLVNPFDDEQRANLDDAPPRAAGSWSNLRAQSLGVSQAEGSENPRTRDSVGQHNVQVLLANPHESDEASLISAQHMDPGQEIIMPTPRMGFSLTPRVSTSFDHLSGYSGSHSSRRTQQSERDTQHTQHTSNSHSQSLSRSSSGHSEHGYVVDGAVNRASLSAVGGNRGAVGPPLLPPLRRISALPQPVAPIDEQRSLEGDARSTSMSTSRPGTGDMTVLSRTETFASGTGSMSTGAPTTVFGTDKS